MVNVLEIKLNCSKFWAVWIFLSKIFSQKVQFDHEFLSDHPLEMISKEQVTLGSGGFFSVLSSFWKFV